MEQLKITWQKNQKILFIIRPCRKSKRNIFCSWYFCRFWTATHKDAGSQNTIGPQKTRSSLTPSKIPAIDAATRPEEYNEKNEVRTFQEQCAWIENSMSSLLPFAWTDRYSMKCVKWSLRLRIAQRPKGERGEPTVGRMPNRTGPRAAKYTVGWALK
jgi:hypothetical protein